MTNATEERRRLRQAVAEHAPLVALLDELYAPTRMPPLNATDREVGAWMGERRLVDRLKALLEESRSASGGALPKVIRS